MKFIFLSMFLAFSFAPTSSLYAQTWGTVKEQIVPEDVAERPPEVHNSVDDFERDTFNRENFYNKSAGTRQYRRSMMAPTKSMDFEVINPLDQKPEEEGPKTKAQIVEKDGKPVTVISINKDAESESE